MTRLMMLSGIAAGFFLIAHVMAAESRDDKEKNAHTIPLSEIVTTSPQEGLKAVQDIMQQKGNAQSGNEYLRKLLAGTNGSSNVFLVDATSIYDALAASFSILVGARSAETPAPVNTAEPKRGSHWLVAYLGSGHSSPSRWTIERVTVDTNKLVLTYRKSSPAPASEDSRQYYYWIPLGKLNPGVYEVQLFDADKEAVILMRRVDVTGK